MRRNSSIGQIPLLKRKRPSFRIRFFKNRKTGITDNDVGDVMENKETQENLRTAFIARAELQPSRETDPLEIECLESCPIEDCVIPARQPYNQAGGRSLPVKNTDARLVADDNRSRADFDNFEMQQKHEDTLSVYRIPNVLPTHLKYVFPSSKSDSKDKILEKLSEYRKDKRKKMLDDERRKAVRLLEEALRKTMKRSEEMMEQVYLNATTPPSNKQNATEQSYLSDSELSQILSEMDTLSIRIDNTHHLGDKQQNDKDEGLDVEEVFKPIHKRDSGGGGAGSRRRSNGLVYATKREFLF